MGCTDSTASAIACFDEEHFAVAGGKVMALALVECVAQTAAAAQGARAWEAQVTESEFDQKMKGKDADKVSDKVELLGQAPTRSLTDQGGMLAAISNFRIEECPGPGTRFQIEVYELKRFGPMLLVSAIVSSNGKVLASGELTLHV